MSTFAKRHELTAGIAVAAVFGSLAAIILTLVWGAFWAGLAASVLWGWFAVPIFGLPALGVAQAYGIALVLRSFRWMTPEDSKTDRSAGEVFARGIMLPPLMCGLFLLCGWVAKAWA